MPASRLPSTSTRLLALERKVQALEGELAVLRSATAINPPAVSPENLDTGLRSLARRIVAGVPHSSYFNIRFRMYEAAMMNIKALGYAIGATEAGRKADRPAPGPSTIPLSSKPCTRADLDADWGRFWSSELNNPVRYHRKLWEFVYIAQALFSAGKLLPGNDGLGFGCGHEPLPSLFAKYGARVVATDLAAEDPKAQSWTQTRQHAEGIAAVRRIDICPDREKLRNISFRPLNMNAVPRGLDGKFDFCWSACALEHLGSIEAGFRFIRNSLRTLKPGGVAVHTTEYTFEPRPTHERWPTVIYREDQLVPFVESLRKDGYAVADLDLAPGDDPLDNFADLSTKELYSSNLRADLHLKTVYDGFVCTSIGLIIEAPKVG
jgi:SAM-dependent methyltransferase